MTFTILHKRVCALVALVAGGLILAGCSAEPAVTEGEPPVVMVSQPIKQDITDYSKFTGRMEAAETVEVRARVRGELIAIHFKAGALVKEGESLFDIDPRMYKADLAMAEAKKANAAASLKLAETEYNRNYLLYQRDASAARDVEAWAARKGIALAEVNQAEAQIDQAKLDVEWTKVKAPISGRISRALVTKGNLVNTGGGETLLTTIVSVDPIFVYFDVDEATLAVYKEKRAKEQPDDKTPPVIPVDMGLVTDGDRFPRKGEIDFAENRVNPATGTIRVRAVFRNEDGQLTPGQFARVRVPTDDNYAGLLVTDVAVGTDQGQKYLLVVNSENKAEYRPVKPGRLDGSLRVFGPDGGLKAGEWVIVNGVQRVRPGSVVKPEHVDMPTLPGKQNKKEDEKKPT